jgi:hypothetical protein
VWDVAHTGDRRGVCMVMVGRSEGKRPLTRLRHRWFGMDLVGLIPV